MAESTAPAFPVDLIISFAFACAVTGGALLLTHFNGDDLRRWWSARSWTSAQCTLIRVDPDVSYRYRVGGRTYESGGLGIGSRFNSLTEAVGGKAPGESLSCWVNPAEPGEALLDREYAGWWWLPGAWLLAVFLLVPTSFALCRSLWAWLTYRPDPPLTWAQWLASFVEGPARIPSAAGAFVLIIGIAATWFLSVTPWLNWYRAQSFKPALCTITRCELRSWSAGSELEATGGYLLSISFAYEHDGRRYTSSTYSPWRLGNTEWILQSSKTRGIGEWQQLLAVGSRHTGYVSPEHPGHAYLSRDKSTFAAYLAAFGPLVSLAGLIILAARPR